ncbi:uncharacterized protein Z518_01465 [Rhinocladiella mackenziei CBS 650.93]|uniref:Prokaryotic-type class I peptide chain release factors domain-containing protein n=1 Tax=Rhinocladiella mackenziei CBS 650.93 TaxID=1442369 RepID=A0A0D2HI71_9EURO|nr:uncharacterized protein Z518_01465 [Rhinocladiella mackenziei CBS 650.93]KIX10383.1 hypothetical protein Z518_01465 [Rhinocladiella mackenziei CBS 650.93]
MALLLLFLVCQRQSGRFWLQVQRRPFTQISRALKNPNPNHLPPRPTLPDSELQHNYVKGSGPGGQKINKTNSAVQLTHIPTGIVVKCQATRSRSQNHTIAKRILAEKVEFLLKGDESRVSKVAERKRKKKKNAGKKRRRKYRRLAAEKEGAVIEEEDGEEWEEDEDDEGEEEEEQRSVTGKDTSDEKIPKG